AILVLLGGLAVGWSMLGPSRNHDPALGPGLVTPRASPLAAGDAPVASPTAPLAAEAASADRRAIEPELAATTGAVALRVLWHDREPAAEIGVALQARTRGKPYGVLAQGVTDAEGRVHFDGLEPGAGAVRTDRLSEWGSDEQNLHVTAGRTTDPDRGPIEVRASFDRPVRKALAQVIGRVLDDGRRLTKPKAATVLLEDESRSWNTARLDDDGRFEFTRVTPGRVRLIVMDGETAVHHGEWFDVAPAE